ncbi:arylesterase [Comamonas serinivorans]|uniref:arylesterase n=1 Tax=Comamonas serinivorans TaxID=1082851 RepID=UPI003AAC141E
MRSGTPRRHFIARAVGLALAGIAAPWSAHAAGGARSGAAPQPGGAGAVASGPRILVLGDSLSAEYGLRRGTGWVALLAQRLQQAGRPEQVVNASISGDTTSGGRARLAALLKQHQPQVLVIELGGNDALRGLPIAMTEQNLTAMVSQGQAAGAKVLLVGMQVPPNYGAAYTRDFEAVFAKVAQARQAALVPFLLKGVADAPDPTAQFQGDRIHPNEQAQPALLANVWPSLARLIGAKA